MMIVLGLLKIAAPVPATPDKFLHNRIGRNKSPFLLRIVFCACGRDDTIGIDPLLPAGRWRYFCLSNLSYHHRDLTVVWDETGQHYGRGQGLRLLVDGKLIASRADLGKLAAILPPK